MNVLDLSGAWRLQNADDSLRVPAVVPGDSYSALFAAGKIPDPYWADNELKVLSLGREDWIYERSFEVSPGLLQEDMVYLEIEGLDTMGRIFVNGRLAGRTRNAFVRYRFDVKPLLKEGNNLIRIEIASPEKTAEREASKLPYPIPHGLNPVQSMHRNLVRKVQCHAGWDWGPCLMISGIEAVRVVGVSPARIESVDVRQRHAPAKGGRPGSVTLEIVTEIFASRRARTDLTVEIDGRKLGSSIALEPGPNTVTRRLKIDQPRLWWPAGQGRQPLYEVMVRVGNAEVRKRIGLRTIKVVSQEDKDGLSLEFVVNGRPIFAKGANWIPADALPQRVTTEILDGLLSSAVAANMNTIRVWGGGRYESDAFYDLCDEKGLMLWHDFMFSCSLYPATEDFLVNVREEARWQVRRLRDRACLAIWCGNNENVGAMTWFKESKENRDRYIVDYDRLNEGVIGAAVRELDPDHLFWPSSPCAGPGDYSDCWHDDRRGDMHFWSVWHEGKPFEDYLKIKPRFCSEFGFQSFPSLSGVREYAPPDQWNVSAPIMEHHQRNVGGNTRIAENMTRYFRYPEGFENFLYLSQVQQGVAIRTAVEHFRRLRPVCMGAIYWQLNDTWPVASWSSLEYGGKWKVLHYMARRFFDPLLITAVKNENDEVEVWVDCDLPAIRPLEAKIRVRTMDFTGRTLKTIRLTARLATPASRRVHTFALSELGVSDPTCCFILVDAAAGGRRSSNELFLTPYKQCVLEKPDIVCTTQTGKKGEISVTLTTKAPAFFVMLDRDDLKGEFDDNVVTLLPGEERVLRFIPAKGISIGANLLRKKLTAHDLRGTY